MLDWCYSFNGTIIISCRCVKLLILGYISVQVEDSKVGEMIYLMRNVKLKLNLSNEQISIRNTREIHEIGKNSRNSNQLAVLPQLAKTLRTLTD